MDPETQELAEALARIAANLFPRGWVSDAVSWKRDGVLYGAWIMPPAKLSNLVSGGSEDSMSIRGPHVSNALRRSGIDDEDFRYETILYAADFLQRLANSLYSISVSGETVMCTLIPEPGYPWPTDDGMYFSAKKGREVESTRPEWLSSDNAVDLCRLWPEAEYTRRGVEYEFRGGYFLATHAMGSFDNLTRSGTWSQNVEVVNRCGGLIAPSIAVGPLPATNFGPFILVADVGVVLDSLKPNRKRGKRPPSKVFNTDAWTVRTKALLEDGSMTAFDQLHGHEEYLTHHGIHLWASGTPEDPSSHLDHLVKRIDTEAQLERAVARRLSMWKRSLTPEQVEKLHRKVEGTADRYAYCEAKVDGVMPISSFPVAVAPDGYESEFAEFLQATGFQGELLLVELPDAILSVLREDWSGEGLISLERKDAIRAWAALAYGWHVADAIREAA